MAVGVERHGSLRVILGTVVYRYLDLLRADHTIADCSGLSTTMPAPGLVL